MYSYITDFGHVVAGGCRRYPRATFGGVAYSWRQEASSDLGDVSHQDHVISGKVSSAIPNQQNSSEPTRALEESGTSVHGNVGNSSPVVNSSLGEGTGDHSRGPVPGKNNLPVNLPHLTVTHCRSVEVVFLVVVDTVLRRGEKRKNTLMTRVNVLLLDLLPLLVMLSMITMIPWRKVIEDVTITGTLETLNGKRTLKVGQLKLHVLSLLFPTAPLTL